jgi:Protein of unknown function (DUF2612)
MADTGPDINRPKPGSNAIGVGAIGIMSIGDIPSFDWVQTVISQYSNSPIITGIIGSFFDAVDQTEDISNFYDDMFNIATAVGYGLDVLGIILNVTRTLDIGVAELFFGFEQAGQPSANPFNTQPFFTGENLNNNFELSDDSYRLLLFAKALYNISPGNIPSINKILQTLFPGRGNAFVTDGLNMTMSYTFQFVLSPVELAIVEQSGVLPKPVGVNASVVQPVS